MISILKLESDPVWSCPYLCKQSISSHFCMSITKIGWKNKNLMTTWIFKNSFKISWYAQHLKLCMCETVGSMMNQHGGKNRYLESEYFSMEMVMRVNLGPLHLLDGLINEVLASYPSKSYRRKIVKNCQILCLQKCINCDFLKKVMRKSAGFLLLFGFNTL